MAGAGAYSQDRALTAREAEAGVLVGAFEDGNYDVFAREAEAEPFEDEIELEVRELKEYMRKRDLFKRLWCPSFACDSDEACTAVNCWAGCNWTTRKCNAYMIGGKGGKAGKGHGH
ncbi:hypothetical protein MMC15_007104 [Xylographa vitiligo]|nr:hypothetical protein [Xylographa vitiligo]